MLEPDDAVPPIHVSTDGGAQTDLAPAEGVPAVVIFHRHFH